MTMGPEWPYRVIIYKDNWPEVQTWCETHIGEFDRDWYKLGIDPLMSLNNGTTETVWYFKTEKNAVLFSLRWS